MNSSFSRQIINKRDWRALGPRGLNLKITKSEDLFDSFRRTEVFLYIC
jgi:hypothetical protein